MNHVQRKHQIRRNDHQDLRLGAILLGFLNAGRHGGRALVDSVISDYAFYLYVMERYSVELGPRWERLNREELALHCLENVIIVWASRIELMELEIDKGTMVNCTAHERICGPQAPKIPIDNRAPSGLAVPPP